MFFTKLRRASASIVVRVTLWYSLLLTGLVVAAIIAFFTLSGFFYSQGQSQYLVARATERAAGLTQTEATADEDNYDDELYYAIYNSSNQLQSGTLPQGFSGSSQPHLGKLVETSRNNQSYLAYDVSLSNGRWLRAVLYQGSYGGEISSLVLTMLVVGPVVIILGLVGGYWILKRAFAPVADMTQTAQTIVDQKDLSAHLQTSDQEDELHQLARVINRMLETLDVVFEREQQLSNDLSHELRTPVAVILSESEYGLQYAESLEESQESFEQIRQQALRMRQLIQQMLELARTGEAATKIESLDLSSLVLQAGSSFQGLAESKGLRLEVEVSPDLQVWGDGLLLGRLLDNLLDNALKFAQSEISLRLSQEESGICLSIADDGPGIPLDQQDKIWDRFYQVSQSRNKSQYQGSGLGLSLVARIAQVHGGQLELDSRPGQGTRFILRLPVAKLKES